jgi:hypothetical protein
METILQVLRRKEAELAILQDEVEKLRAAVQIVAREQAITPEVAPSANIEAQLQAAVASSNVSAPAPMQFPLKKTLP